MTFMATSKKTTVQKIEAARLRGTPRLKAVAQATGSALPQAPYPRQKKPR